MGYTTFRLLFKEMSFRLDMRIVIDIQCRIAELNLVYNLIFHSLWTNVPGKGMNSSSSRCGLNNSLGSLAFNGIQSRRRKNINSSLRAFWKLCGTFCVSCLLSVLTKTVTGSNSGFTIIIWVGSLVVQF